MAKQLLIGKEKQQIICHMDCHGQLCVTFHNDVAVVEITHHQAHKQYVNIDLPANLHEFIKDNHKMGPAKVHRQIKDYQIQWNWMKFDSSGRTSPSNPKVTG